MTKTVIWISFSLPVIFMILENRLVNAIYSSGKSIIRIQIHQSLIISIHNIIYFILQYLHLFYRCYLVTAKGCQLLYICYILCNYKSLNSCPSTVINADIDFYVKLGILLRYKQKENIVHLHKFYRA